MEERKIAVIVPVYNTEKYLQQCIDSILGQTYGNLELWLIDDGSKDGSPAMCDAAAAADPRVHVIHKQNEGLMATWMRGVKESSAPYLFFVDGDDWIDLNTLEDMARCFRPDRVPGEDRQIICCDTLIEREYNGTSEPTGSTGEPGIYEGEKLQSGIRNRVLGNYGAQRLVTMSRCMKVFSRRLIEDNMHYCNPKIRMGEDVNITLPALLDADRVVLMEKAYHYHYRFVAESMVHKYDPGMYDNMKLLISIVRTVLADKGVPGAETMADREYVLLLNILMKNELRNTDPGAVSYIKKICDAERTAELTKRTGTPAAGMGDRIASMVLKYPVRPVIAGARAVFLRANRH